MASRQIWHPMLFLLLLLLQALIVSLSPRVEAARVEYFFEDDEIDDSANLHRELSVNGSKATVRKHMLDDLPGETPYIVMKTSYGALTYHYKDHFTYREAKDFCAYYTEVSNAATIVTIQSKTKQKQVEGLIRRARGYAQYSPGAWIDAHFYSDCQVYKRDSDGLIFYQTDPNFALEYSNWGPDQPQTSDGTCVFISYGSRLKWSAADCEPPESVFAAICQWTKCSRWLNFQSACERQPGCWFDDSRGDCLEKHR